MYRCPMPNAPEPGGIRNPAPVLEPTGRGFCMKLTTVRDISIVLCNQYMESWLTYTLRWSHNMRIFQQTPLQLLSRRSKE